MKKIVKDAVGHHPIHVLKRMVIPIYQDFERIIEQGTESDSWQTLEAITLECQKLRSKH